MFFIDKKTSRNKTMSTRISCIALKVVCIDVDGTLHNIFLKARGNHIFVVKNKTSQSFYVVKSPREPYTQYTIKIEQNMGPYLYTRKLLLYLSHDKTERCDVNKCHAT